MYRCEIARLLPGMVLGKTLYSERGEVLFWAGTALEPEYIEALAWRGFGSVLVRDGLSDDLVPRDAVSEQLRAVMTNRVQRFFTQVRRAWLEELGPAKSCGGARRVNRAGRAPSALPAEVGESLGLLSETVEDLLRELSGSRQAAGLPSVTCRSMYLYQHSVDVAVLGALLGQRAGLPPWQLHELVLGCLLHDLGLAVLDPRSHRETDDPNGEELGAPEQHPRLGFELIRRLPLAGDLPALIALQHHEHQDGRGYPTGLLGRGDDPGGTWDRPTPGRIMPLVELAAAADVFCALTSDRPGRPALPTDRALEAVCELVDRQLSPRAVRLLTTVVPPFPVGQWVELADGPRRGWRGVVSDLPVAAPWAPLVRLLLDARGEALASPHELDLRRAPVGLRSVQPERAFCAA